MLVFHVVLLERLRPDVLQPLNPGPEIAEEPGHHQISSLQIRTPSESLAARLCRSFLQGIMASNPLQSPSLWTSEDGTLKRRPC